MTFLVLLSRQFGKRRDRASVYPSLLLSWMHYEENLGAEKEEEVTKQFWLVALCANPGCPVGSFDLPGRWAPYDDHFQSYDEAVEYQGFLQASKKADYNAELMKGEHVRRQVKEAQARGLCFVSKLLTCPHCGTVAPIEEFEYLVRQGAFDTSPATSSSSDAST